MSLIDSQLANAVTYLGTVTPARRFFTVEAPLPGNDDEVLSDLTFTLGAQPVLTNVFVNGDTPIADAAAFTLHLFLNGQSVVAQPIVLGKPVKFAQSHDICKSLRRAHWSFVVVGRVPTVVPCHTRYALFAHLDYFAYKPSAEVRRALAVPHVRLEFDGGLAIMYSQNTGELHYADSSCSLPNYGVHRLLAPESEPPQLQGERTSVVGNGATAYLQADGSAVLDMELCETLSLLQQVRLVHDSKGAANDAFPPITVKALLSTTAVDKVTRGGSLFGGQCTTLGYNVLSSSAVDSVRFSVEFESLAKFIEAFTYNTSATTDTLFNVYSTFVARA